MNPSTHNFLAYGSSGFPRVPHRFSHVAASDTTTTQSFIDTKNGGGDPVTALAVRPESASQSVAARDARVRKDMAVSLAKLSKR